MYIHVCISAGRFGETISNGVCVCTCVCTCVDIYIYSLMYIFIHMDTHVHICKHRTIRSGRRKWLKSKLNRHKRYACVRF